MGNHKQEKGRHTAAPAPLPEWLKQLQDQAADYETRGDLAGAALIRKMIAPVEGFVGTLPPPTDYTRNLAALEVDALRDALAKYADAGPEKANEVAFLCGEHLGFVLAMAFFDPQSKEAARRQQFRTALSVDGSLRLRLLYAIATGGKWRKEGGTC